MREIKFRGKTLSGKWVYGYAAKFAHDSVPVILEDTEDGITPRKIIPETVCQFTGLHDKNGREIYEGDVIRSDCGNGEVRHLISFFDIIASFVAEMLLDNDINDYCTLSQAWILNYNKEVIGNIHDNPELLKTE